MEGASSPFEPVPTSADGWTGPSARGAGPAQEQAPQAAGEPEHDRGQAGEQEAPSGLVPEDWQEQLERLAREKEELTHQLVRLQADFDNFRRRQRWELERSVDEAVGRLAARMLQVVDNLERALAVAARAEADAAEAAGGGGGLLAGLLSGLRMVHQELLRALAEEGVQRIAAEGEPFDPQVHQAVEQVPVQEPGKDRLVLEELQPGYHFRGRVLRPSLVRVGVLVPSGSPAGPSPPASSPAQGAQEGA